MSNSGRENGILFPTILLRKEYTSTLDLPIFNVSDTDMIIKKGMKVGTVELLPEFPVHEVLVTESQDKTTTEKNTDLEAEHLGQIYSRIHDGASYEAKEKMRQLLKKYADIFAKPGELGNITCYKHTIKLLPGAKPVKKAPYRKPLHLEKFEREKIDELLELGVIRPSYSPWGM